MLCLMTNYVLRLQYGCAQGGTKAHAACANDQDTPSGQAVASRRLAQSFIRQFGSSLQTMSWQCKTLLSRLKLHTGCAQKHRQHLIMSNKEAEFN